MVWTLLIPVLFAGAGLAVLGERAVALYYRLPSDPKPVREAVSRALSAGPDAARLATLGAHLAPTAMGHAVTLVAPATSPEMFDVLRAEALSDVTFDAGLRLDTLRALGRVASLSGFLGAMLEIIWLFGGDRGLLGLQAGLAERVALERGLLSVCIGIGAAILAATGHRTFSREASRIVDDTTRVLGTISRLAFPQAPTPASGGEPKDQVRSDVPT